MPPGRAVPQAVRRLPGLTRMKAQTKQLINKKNINKKFPGNHNDFSGAKVVKIKASGKGFSGKLVDR